MSVVVRTRRGLVGICVLLLAAMGLGPASVLGASTARAAVVCVDLAISGFTTNPAQPVAGQPTDISIPVTNQGTCASQAFVVQFMQSQFATAGPSTQVLGLAAGATTTVHLTYTFPSPGNFLTVAQADPGNKIPETNKNNNLAIHSLTVVASSVDLAITSFTLNPTRPVQGRSTTASITVANNGNTDAGPFRLEWDPRPGVMVSMQVSGVPAAGSQTFTLAYTYWMTGTVQSKAVADGTFMLPDVNRLNNTSTLSVTVIPPLPDLTVASVTTSPSNAVAGVPVTATFVVHNAGVSPAGTFLVEWQPGPGILPIVVQVKGPLAVGASRTLSLKYTYAKAGTYDSSFTVDSSNWVKELDETNNTATFQVAVAAPFIDLVAIGLTANPPNPQQGVATTISVTVQNQGNIAAGPFLVAWNPDTLGLIVPSVQTLSQQVNGLAAGATTVVNFSFAYPEFGNFRTLAQVDPFNAVKETNKTNNQLLLYLTVSPGNVDVDVTGVTVAATYPGATSGSPIVRASEATASITITNEGTFPAGNFALQWRYKSTDTSGPTISLPGLVAGATETVTINGAFPTAGTYDSSVVVDPYNQLIEPGEPAQPNDPDAVLTTPVTVQPRQSVVKIALDSVHFIQTLYSKDDHDWYTKFAVLEPNPPNGPTACHFFQSLHDVSVPGLTCQSNTMHPNNDGDTLAWPDAGSPIQVTLNESTPLVAAFTGAEINFSCGFLCLSPSFSANFVGVALVLEGYPDYAGTNTFTVAGAGAMSIPLGGGTSSKLCGDGHCFDITVTVTSIKLPPPLFMAAFATSSGLTATAATPDASAQPSAMTATATAATMPPSEQATYNNFVNTTQSLIGQANKWPFSDWKDF